MATICMLGHPAAGHIHPTLPIGAELVRRGDAVHYLATEPFRTKIEATGATFGSYGDHALFERSLGRGGLLGGMAGLLETAEEILPRVLDVLREVEPDLLLVEAHAVWGNLAAQITRVPAITLSSMFAMSEQLRTPAQLLDHVYGSASREQLVDALAAFTRVLGIALRLDRRYGTRTPGIVDYLGNRNPLNLVLTARELQPGAEQLDGTYVFTGASLPAGCTPRSRDGRSVLVAMGTMYNDEPELYRAVMSAFGDTELRVTLAVGTRTDRSLLPPAPRNVAVHETVPQIEALRDADLFVTHGGINSAHEAMLLGVPMIVLPRAADHHIVARQVAEAGAGVVLERSAATAARLRDLAKEVLDDPRYAKRSASLGDALRAAGGARAAADRIRGFLDERVATNATAEAVAC